MQLFLTLYALKKRTNHRLHNQLHYRPKVSEIISLRGRLVGLLHYLSKSVVQFLKNLAILSSNVLINQCDFYTQFPGEDEDRLVEIKEVLLVS